MVEKTQEDLVGSRIRKMLGMGTNEKPDAMVMEIGLGGDEDESLNSSEAAFEAASEEALKALESKDAKEFGNAVRIMFECLMEHGSSKEEPQEDSKDEY